MFLFFSLYLLLFSSSYSLCFLLLVLVPLAHFLLKHFFSIFPQFFSINLGGTVFFLFSIRFFVFIFIRKYLFFDFFSSDLFKKLARGSLTPVSIYALCSSSPITPSTGWTRKTRKTLITLKTRNE